MLSLLILIDLIKIDFYFIILFFNLVIYISIRIHIIELLNIEI